jgi:hypothetical protein
MPSSRTKGKRKEKVLQVETYQLKIVIGNEFLLLIQQQLY